MSELHLLDQVRDALRVLREQEMAGFLIHLAVQQHVAAATQNQAIPLFCSREFRITDSEIATVDRFS